MQWCRRLVDEVLLLTAREIQSRGNMNLDVKGFVNDDVHKQGSVIQRLKVLGLGTYLVLSMSLG
jgi:hypothetical protein